MSDLTITSKFGEIDNVHKIPHTGLDIAIPTGTPVHSVGYGIVEKVVDYGSENIGKGVIVRQTDGTQVIYGHFSEIKVSKGQPVFKGQMLGLSGNTGRSTGPHLHLQLVKAGKLADPAEHIELRTVVGDSSTPTPPHSGFGFDLVTPIALSFLLVILIIIAGGKKVVFTPISLLVMVGLLIFFGVPMWSALGNLLAGGFLDIPMMVGTIIAIWFWMLGSEWPKRYVFWGWIIFWVLRGVVFA